MMMINILYTYDNPAIIQSWTEVEPQTGHMWRLTPEISILPHIDSLSGDIS